MYSNTSKDYSGKKDTLNEQMISGNNLFGVAKVRYPYLVVMGENMRRRVGEELYSDRIEGNVKNLRSIVVWACMSADGVGRLHVIDGTLNANG